MSDQAQLRAEPATKPEPARIVDWPRTEQFYLTLDLECDFGTALETNTYQAISQIDRLVSLLEVTSTPLTCFVQTELLDTHPEAIEMLRQCDVPVRFHPHSHVHRPRDQISVREEVELSTDRFADFFDEHPTGYRFPNGNVQHEDYQVLASAGYRFDASVFPTWRPGYFNNTSASTTPTYREQFDLFELPFTLLSPNLPLPTGLSYARVFGRLYTNRLLRSPPAHLVFNIHMHDLYTPSSVTKLPLAYRALYSRNDRGFELLRSILARFAESEYSFSTLNDAHDQLRDGTTSLP